MQTAVTPDCLVSALISLPVPAAPNFQPLESEETSPCLPGTRHTGKQLVSMGRAGRQESTKNNHRTHAVVFLPLAFTPGMLLTSCPLLLQCSAPAQGTELPGHQPSTGFSSLSSHVLFRIRFYTSGSAVMFFLWGKQVLALPRFAGPGCAVSSAECAGWWHWVAWPGQLVGQQSKAGCPPHTDVLFWSSLRDQQLPHAQSQVLC